MIHYVDRGQTVNHQYYIDYCLKSLINNIRKQRPLYGVQGIELHYGNGRSHAHNDVPDYLKSDDIIIIPPSPNSRDFSPCDFWLFNLIKQDLLDQNNSEPLYRAVFNFMNSLDKEEDRKTFNKWVQRMHLCMDNDSDYFEDLMD